MRAQVHPISVGRVLLDHDRLDLLWEAEAFDALRLGCPGVGYTDVGSKCKICKLCGVKVQGVAHILAECESLREERRCFLSACGGKWGYVLQGAPAGDWPTAVLSPHSGVHELAAAVQFGGAVMKKLRASNWLKILD